MPVNTFRQAARENDFVVTAELNLRPGTTTGQIRDAVKVFAGVVDAVQIADDRAAKGHMSGLAVASLAIQQGLDAVLHVSCRDRNRIAVQADVLGAAALGVTSLMLLRGEKLEKDSGLRAKGVFELNANSLMKIAKLVSEQRAFVSDPGFYLGSQIAAFPPPADWEAVRIIEKIEAGAQFLQTRPCLNADVTRRYMAKLVELKVTYSASVIVDVPLLRSVEDIRTLQAEFPAVQVGDEALKRIMAAADPREEGVAVSVEMIRAMRAVPGVLGVNIRSFGDPEDVVAIIRPAMQDD